MNEPYDDSIHALSGAYAVDAVDADERDAFEQHLERCPDCQDEVRGLREAAARMSLTSEVAPPPSLRDSVLGAIGSVRPLPPQVDRPGVRPTPEPAAAGPEIDETSEETTTDDRIVPMRSRSRSLATRSRLAVAAVAAAVVAVVGIGVAQPWTDDQAPGLTVAQRVLDASDAQQVSQSFDDGSSATVTRSAAEARAVIETQDMAAPPSDRVYELWLMDDDGNASRAGLMTEAGDTSVVLDGDASEAAAVAITVEPEGGSEQPTSQPIAMFDLGEATA